MSLRLAALAIAVCAGSANLIACDGSDEQEGGGLSARDREAIVATYSRLTGALSDRDSPGDPATICRVLSLDGRRAYGVSRPESMATCERHLALVQRLRRKAGKERNLVKPRIVELRRAGSAVVAEVHSEGNGRSRVRFVKTDAGWRVDGGSGGAVGG